LPGVRDLVFKLENVHKKGRMWRAVGRPGGDGGPDRSALRRTGLGFQTRALTDTRGGS